MGLSGHRSLGPARRPVTRRHRTALLDFRRPAPAHVAVLVTLVGQDTQAAQSGQRAIIQAQASDKRAEQTYLDAETILAECLELQKHLQGQDEVLERLIAERG